MRMTDVVNQLSAIIPQYCNYFSTQIDILTAVDNGSEATITTDGDHGLVINEPINIVNVESSIKITAVSIEIIEGFTVALITTELDHDYTLNKRETVPQFVKINNFTDTDWNGSFQLVQVVNRHNLKIVNPNTATAPTLNGAEISEKVIFGYFNGPQLVTSVPATNIFTYDSDNVITGTGGILNKKIRISGTADFAGAEREYTKQGHLEFYMFVHPPDSVNANKSRGSSTDINNESLPENYFEMEVRDGFILLIFANTAEEAAGLETLDIIRNEVFACISKAVRGFRFPSGFTCESNQVTDFLNHGVLNYEKSLFIYQFVFEMPLVLLNQDGYVDGDRAFRDIDFTTKISSDENVESVTVENLDLDDEPITS